MLERKINTEGFTLVELAIVMTIVGILIGGIIKGQELMMNARVTATIAQVRSYEAALSTFSDTYSAKPGDYGRAQATIANCNVANACVNGDSNGFVGLHDLAWMHIDATVISENTQFWKHLFAADIISGGNPSAQTATWGESHPAGRFNGGFFVREANSTPALPGGLVLVMRSTISGVWLDTSGLAIAPRYAALIDRKMDDGSAGAGFVQSISAAHANGCGYPNTGSNGPSGYDESGSADNCDMMFKM